MPKQPKEKKESSKKSTSSKAQGKKPAQPVKVAPPAKSTVTEEVEVSNEDVEGDGSEWEDEDDEESKAAVDRVLNKYAKAKVMEDDKDGDFDARYEMSIKDKMDEWKRGYYRVSFTTHECQPYSRSHYSGFRGNWRYRMTTRRRWEI